MENKSGKIKSTREIIGPIFWIKLVGIGDENVGKTCLVRSVCDKKFSKTYFPTVGVDYGFKVHELEGMEYRLNFWDFGGDLEYELVRKELYKDTQGCMLVFDVSNKTTFENLETWVQEFSDHGGSGAVMIVVANKSDKVSRQVTTADGMKWAESHGFRYYETSSSSGAGVKEMLNGLLNTIIERKMIKPKWIGKENKPTA